MSCKCESNIYNYRGNWGSIFVFRILWIRFLLFEDTLRLSIRGSNASIVFSSELLLNSICPTKYRAERLIDLDRLPGLNPWVLTLWVIVGGPLFITSLLYKLQKTLPFSFKKRFGYFIYLLVSRTELPCIRMVM